MALDQDTEEPKFDLERQLDFEIKLRAARQEGNENLAEELVFDHINTVISHDAKVSGSDLSFPPPDCEWINLDSEKGDDTWSQELKHAIKVLDFFTYCCINCMHIIPTLQQLEDEFAPQKQSGVVVFGVHSPKFSNEQLSSSVVNAIHRHALHHPVINDRSYNIWNKFEIDCWPTIVILGPNNRIVFKLIGEQEIKEWLIYFVSKLHQYLRTRQGHEFPSISLPLLSWSSVLSKEESLLKYPGKVSVSPNGLKLAISDTGHHRIIICDENGVIENIIGSPLEAGLQDGSPKEARFRSPQGTEWLSDRILFVADTENDAIRKVDLKEGIITTVASSLNSPWDLAITEDKTKLFIAMAGSHQIWVYFLEAEPGSAHKQGECIVYSGNGREENRNNHYRLKAGFAQPSGVDYCPLDNCIYIADSESSCVRVINLNTGAVKGVIGGVRDPQDLFAFGDIDGIGIEVKLQHPLGVAFCMSSGTLMVADSYNHKIKEVALESKECLTIAGMGEPGDRSACRLINAQFNEPGGICCYENFLYVADTNNHKIKVINLDNDWVEDLPFRLRDEATSLDQNDAKTTNNGLNNDTITFDENVISLSPNHPSVDIAFSLKAANDSLKFTSAAISIENLPSSIKILPSNQLTFKSEQQDNDIEDQQKQERNFQGQQVIKFSFSVLLDNVEGETQSKAIQTTIALNCKSYMCSKDAGACILKRLNFAIPLSVCSSNENNDKDSSLIELSHTIK